MSQPKSTIPGLQGVTDAQRQAYLSNYTAHQVGISAEQMIANYDAWAQRGTYEQDLNQELYNGPKYAAEFLDKYLQERPKDCRILDVAAGTGYVAEQLHKLGYRNIDALEPSAGMRNVARNKGVYHNIYSDYLTAQPTSIQPDSYDALVISGGMGEGHVPSGALWEMLRVVKPGGSIVIVMREEYLSYVEEYKENLEPLMAQIEQNGWWTRRERTVVKEYSFKKNGVIFAFTVHKKSA